MTDSIDYGNLMHQAMRGLIKQVLSDVQSNGLPGEHHFFITFDTEHPEVTIPDWLSGRYPNEMTVVMQHWYDKLEVGDDGFGIQLNFGDAPEPLFVPYDAIKTFVDPSVEFGLRFEAQEDEDSAEDQVKDDGPSDDEPVHLPASKTTSEKPDGTTQEAEVVSLDSFRK